MRILELGIPRLDSSVQSWYVVDNRCHPQTANGFNQV
jgi:hypothetical protein